MSGDQKNPAFLQGAENLRLAANMAGTSVGPLACPAAPARSQFGNDARAREAQALRQPPAQTCQQRLKLTFYFDGTGNNRDADVPTYEHSNVARMFRAAPDDSVSLGIYSFYVPGLGTYFREINDRGESLGKAFLLAKEKNACNGRSGSCRSAERPPKTWLASTSPSSASPAVLRWPGRSPIAFRNCANRRGVDGASRAPPSRSTSTSWACGTPSPRWVSSRA